MVRRVNIKPEMIAWAIQRAGYDVVAYLSEHPDVDEWYKEEKQPTEKQLGFQLECLRHGSFCPEEARVVD